MLSDSKIVNRYTTLDDIDDIRKNVGFHFTSTQNLESILENGLLPRFGANSSGALGQSAIPKPYISYGLEGVMQLYNRGLNLSLEMPIKYFQDPSHKTFLPNTTQTRNIDSRLSILEGFEFVRQYMENNTYLIFETTMSQYEHPLEDDELDKINNEIKTYVDEDGKNICERIDFFNKQIKNLANDRDTDHSAEIDRYTKQRNQLAIEVWKKTSCLVNKKQGRLLNENETIIMDKIDFNDERLRWENYEKNPHNAHTRIQEEQDGKLSGIPILPQTIYQFSNDGENHGNGVQFFLKMYSFIRQSDKVSLQNRYGVDVNLLNLFYEYVNLIEKYKSQNPELLIVRQKQDVKLDNGKIITYPEGITLDLDSISRYPGLEDFEEKASQYYQEERKKCIQIYKQLNGQISTQNLGESDIRFFHDQKSDDFFEDMQSGRYSISMQTAAENAMIQGITTEDINKVKRIERTEKAEDKSEVSRND